MIDKIRHGLVLTTQTLFLLIACTLTAFSSNTDANSISSLIAPPDPFNVLVKEQWKNGQVVDVEQMELNSKTSWQEATAPPSETRHLPADLHPKVQSWLITKNSSDIVDIIVTTRHQLKIPQFPEMDVSQPRSAVVNTDALERTELIISELENRRHTANQSLLQVLNELGGTAIREYWIAPSVRVSIPLGAVPVLLERPDVVYIDPAQGDELPPTADTYALNDVINAREQIKSDPYYSNARQALSWIALLDSGVNKDHQMLSKPSPRISRWKDCSDNSIDCSGPEPADSCWSHGTSSAGIVSGTDALGYEFRGASGFLIDSYKVYPDADGDCVDVGLDHDATVVAFQEAVKWGARIVIAEMQGNGNEFSAISQAADGAFDAGAVVVAAAGNNGPDWNTINAPANAHKVIGVGSYAVTTLAQSTFQSRGPANDERIKPDIQLPTGTETASTGCYFGVPCTWSSDEALWVYSGTSGAVPFAGAVAALYRNWMLGTGSFEPGHIYARLIMSGQEPYPFENIDGAGRVIMAVNGMSWRGKVSIEHNQIIDIPIQVLTPRAHDIDVGLWWPESGDVHSNIDMVIVSPAGVEEDWSLSSPSVFERARVEGPVSSGTWILRLSGASVAGRQTVYFSTRVGL